MHQTHLNSLQIIHKQGFVRFIFIKFGAPFVSVHFTLWVLLKFTENHDIEFSTILRVAAFSLLAGAISGIPLWLVLSNFIKKHPPRK